MEKLFSDLITLLFKPFKLLVKFVILVVLLELTIWGAIILNLFLKNVQGLFY